ncbi:MAG: hypothetical protein D6796_16690 [Caldilineae bacterium]|nr:MAG: hypothetical protein D6796_16690 [Caldilineae bacterium]
MNRPPAEAASPPRYFSLLDVGTDTIKTAVVEVEAEQVTVLAHSLAPAGGRDVAGGRAQAAALTSVVNAALQEAEDATETLAGRKIVPDDALFLLPERALQGACFTVKQQRAHPAEPITRRELDALWERALRLARQKLPTLPGAGADWVPQTVTPAGLWLDDHLANDPLGLQGRTLSLSVYGTICQPAILRGLQQLAERLEVNIYRLVPASQALATIVPARDALTLNVGANGTDISLLRRDALVAACYVPLGGAFFTQIMSHTFRCNLPDAEALKVAFAAYALSEGDVELVERSLQQPLRRWAGAAAEAVGAMLEADGETTLPGHLYFTGGSAFLPGLQEAFLAALKEGGFPFARSPEVGMLGQSALPGFRNEPSGFRGILFAPVLSLARTI